LRWFELVPVLSWVMLRGRCRTCRSRIPFRFWLAEVFAFCFPFALPLVFLSLQDWKYRYIYSWQLVFLLFLGLPAHFPYALPVLFLRCGLADRLIIVYLSMILPLAAFPPFLLVASVSGILYILLTKTRKLPFIPFITLAYILVMYFS
jgi:prepilin signal peptidase PulO-like enzyme (type II secretory pathway)